MTGNPTSVAGQSVEQAFTGLFREEMEILEQADRFGFNELYPLAERMDEGEWWPEGIFAKIGETGLFGVTAPEAYGGSGLDLTASGLVLQAFARWNHALALAWVAHENRCLPTSCATPAPWTRAAAAVATSTGLPPLRYSTSPRP